MPVAEISSRLNRAPVSIITGFLGSGKTTLLNHLVHQEGMESTAVIINEIGEVGLDHLLVESAIENILMLENGCICCSIRGDLIDTICDLFAKVQNAQIPEFTRILVETTGLAHPGPIVQSLQCEEAVIRRCRLDCVITMVDGVQGAVQIAQYEEAVTQIAQADTVLLTKSDLCAPGSLVNLRHEILQINPAVTITAVEFGRIDPDRLFRTVGKDRPLTATHHHREVSNGEHRHGEIFTCSLIHDAPLDEARLRNWLAMIYSLKPHAMLRLKGFARLLHSSRPLFIQAVGATISSIEWLDEWPDGNPATRLVFIFKGMSPHAVKESFQRHVMI
ncbi:MAG: GTP-binding protein [Gammaproteobacteria bacterium]|nr:GTP-binding protein [Gammaproteobacteria bacterium]